MLTFWHNFVKTFGTDAQLDAALDDVWKHRALQYLRYNELMDATNYYRRELDKENQPDRQGYWRNRPKSYERLAPSLVRLGRRLGRTAEYVYRDRAASGGRAHPGRGTRGGRPDATT